MTMPGQNDQMHPDDRRNLVIFILAALLIYFAFDHFMIQPQLEAVRAAREAAQQAPDHLLPGVDGMPAVQVVRSRDEIVDSAIDSGARSGIDNGSVFGTLPLVGNRIDDIQLTNYFTVLHGDDHVPVLSPAGTRRPIFAEFGWIADAGAVAVPGRDTRWDVVGNGILSHNNPVTLRWDNGRGQVFTRTLSMDAHYRITVRQDVKNNAAAAVTLYPYALVAGIGVPDDFSKMYIAHEGPIGYIGDKLHEVKYKDLDKRGERIETASHGWVGITEKYWIAALIPQQGESVKYRFVGTNTDGGARRYQTDIMGQARIIEPGQSADFTTHLFAGAKELKLLDRIEKELGAPHFDLAVDFGLWYFLTKPFFHLLSFLWTHVGNFGIAIILFTILLRVVLFPLNNTSYRSFAKLKKVAPEMTALRDKYKDDKQKLQQELIALYSREKVNPAAGCLPILLQIPIFFALYKVLSVSIEMRHAPFFGWIHDLSVPDPTSVFNLFGLLPYNVPGFLMIGAWPCLMLISMLVQKSMNPPPQDPMQAKIMNLMPWFLAFIMAKFAAGLVIYWTVSNILSIIQQYIIMRSMGVEVKFFHKTPAEEKLEEQVKHGPAVHPGVEMIEEKVEDALFGDHAAPESPSVTPPKGRKKKKR